MENPIIFTAEIIGTIAFASSGAMLGILGADAAGSIPGSGLCAGGAGNLRSFIFTCLWKAGNHDEPLSDDL